MAPIQINPLVSAKEPNGKINLSLAYIFVSIELRPDGGVQDHKAPTVDKDAGETEQDVALFWQSGGSADNAGQWGKGEEGEQ